MIHSHNNDPRMRDNSIIVAIAVVVILGCVIWWFLHKIP